MSEVPLYTRFAGHESREMSPNGAGSSGRCPWIFGDLQGYLVMRNRHRVGPYSRTMPRLLRRSYGGQAFSYERGGPPPRSPPLSHTHSLTH